MNPLGVLWICAKESMGIQDAVDSCFTWLTIFVCWAFMCVVCC